MNIDLSCVIDHGDRSRLLGMLTRQWVMIDDAGNY